MDKTVLVQRVAGLFRLNGYHVRTSVKVGESEIDIVAEARQGLFRPTVLIECAQYTKSVGVEKMRQDKDKLTTARDTNPGKYVIGHVSSSGYTPDAFAMAERCGIRTYNLDDLYSQLINFGDYLEFIKSDKLQGPIKKEYQRSKAFFTSNTASKFDAIDLLKTWIKSDGRCLFVLGDYGVEKSWLLKKLLFDLASSYENDQKDNPIPFFVPLYKFPKAFDFKNLIIRMFEDCGLSGAHYDSFQYMLKNGRIILLLDAFDEMAQHLTRTVVRSNLAELLSVCENDAKVIITSRPNYFEHQLEPLMVLEGIESVHISDREIVEAAQKEVSAIHIHVSRAKMARLEDLSAKQREKLFESVLGADTPAYKYLLSLFRQFEQLESLTQRAVIARLLTFVAESMATGSVVEAEGFIVTEDDLNNFDRIVMFRIIINGSIRVK